MGYGTVAIRHNNGSYETVSKISGSEPYVSLMQELIQPANFTPDGKRIPDGMSWQDWILWRAKRRMNKTLGRPAAPQVAGLSIMVSQLLEAAQAKLGEKVKAAVLSQPDALTLTDEEVDDIFDHLGIKNLMSDKRDPLFSQLFATSVAYAGYGKGLCGNYTDVYGCETEEYFFPSKWTLFLDYSQESLSGGFGHVQDARMFRVQLKFVEPSLGCRHLSDYTDEDMYWTKVTSRIREFVMSTRREVQELVLTGESVSDQRFHTALRNALAEFSSGRGSVVFLGREMLEMLEEIEQLDFLFATAKGAAEFAKRRLEDIHKLRVLDISPSGSLVISSLVLQKYLKDLSEASAEKADALMHSGLFRRGTGRPEDKATSLTFKY
ncbi:hypothetical protein EG329_000254 [Mollisiaceae sp. DMI_Dod_QoI]|nr:hypothetical protein EG329_000254 [Helotiales sp. DMI_Dod_QoI]